MERYNNKGMNKYDLGRTQWDSHTGMSCDHFKYELLTFETKSVLLFDAQTRYSQLHPPQGLTTLRKYQNRFCRSYLSNNCFLSSVHDESTSLHLGLTYL